MINDECQAQWLTACSFLRLYELDVHDTQWMSGRTVLSQCISEFKEGLL